MHFLGFRTTFRDFDPLFGVLVHFIGFGLFYEFWSTFGVFLSFLVVWTTFRDFDQLFGVLIHFPGFGSLSGFGPLSGFDTFISRVILVVLFNAVFPLVTSLIENVTVGSFVVLRPLVRDVISTDSPVFTWTFLIKVSSIGFMIGSK